jgi:hypothetical protein
MAITEGSTMARRSREAVQKRLRERRRAEKAEQKRLKRLARKQGRGDETDEGTADGEPGETAYAVATEESTPVGEASPAEDPNKTD